MHPEGLGEKAGHLEGAPGGAAVPPHQEEPAEVAQASVGDPPGRLSGEGGAPGTSITAETLIQVVLLQEIKLISSGTSTLDSHNMSNLTGSSSLASYLQNLPVGQNSF